MKKTSIFLIFIGCLCFLYLTSCNSSGSAFKLFTTSTPTFTSTPTRTPTPTSTSTPTNTQTPTATPIPPIKIEPCSSSACSGYIDNFNFLNSDPASGQIFTVDVPYGQSVSFRTGWWAHDEQIVRNNINQLDFFFLVDGQNYWQDAMVGEPEQLILDNVPGEFFSQAIEGAVLSEWEIGETYEIRIGAVMKEEVTDGWSIYEPGDKLEITYIVKIVPSCEVNSSIEIENTTGGEVHLKLDGPWIFDFYIPSGISTYDVCYGGYSFIATGCGGATDFGIMSSGESHEFYCN